MQSTAQQIATKIRKKSDVAKVSRKVGRGGPGLVGGPGKRNK